MIDQWKPQSHDQWKTTTYEEPKRVSWNDSVPIKEEKTIVTERVITMEEWNARQRNQQIQPAILTSNYQYGKKTLSVFNIFVVLPIDQRSFVFSDRDRVLQEMIFNRPTPLN